MNILFFAPTLLASAIGRVSKLIVAELQQQGHKVVVVRTEAPVFFQNPTHVFSCQIVPWNDYQKISQLAVESELAIYQIGDNYQYHCGCLEWLPSTPGLVSLHDNFLGHLFWSWSEKIGRPRALELLMTLYGSEVARRFFDHANSASFIEYASQAAPMTEWIASMATAVIVHSSWAMSRIVATCSGPVEVVPLPYDAPFLELGATKGKSTKHDDVVVLTIGHVNHNKRYESVIKAIGASPRLSQNISFRIVGPVEPAVAQELATLADNLSVKVTITGAVDDRQLAEEVLRADIMSCLRWPALEAASASTIESMLYGKPTLVTNTGFYRDLPDGCVLKISQEAEIAEIRAALEKLVASPSERAVMGESAQRYAVETFRADGYATHISNMKRRIDNAKILKAGATVFSNMLKRWGATGEPAMMEAITKPLTLLQ